jgi:FkbM family methyltransferase
LKKAVTYIRYFSDYLRFGDFLSILSSVKYLLNKTSHRQNRIIRTSVGWFYCRSNTNDFQFANYYYEWGVKKFIMNRINQFSVFIDGGACTGDYSILLSRYHLRCIAFEPMPDNFLTINRNLVLNGIDGNVKAYQMGLGNSNTKARFSFNPVNTGASHLDSRNKPDSYEVDIRTFDSLLPELNLNENERILFKLDVEGMEPEALEGCTRFIQQYPNIMFVMEEKHAGHDRIKTTLNKIAVFEYGIVDEFNIYARKITNLN